MKCPNCQHENPEEALYCMKCGAKLERNCLDCGASNPIEALFCIKCGKLIEEKASPTVSVDLPPKSLPAEIKASEGERRQLTVMFCDLVGSSALSEKLDPEDLRDVMKRYQEICADVISRLDGQIAKYLGDGILVYFGYPMAHEDDAKRAVHTALEIVEEINKLNTSLQNSIGLDLAVRLGIHTGLVVVGEMGGGDAHEPMAIVGETPNISARLQELASTNSVVVSSATHKLIQGFFNCELLGSYTLKGFSQPMELYKVIQESEVQSRFEAAVVKGLTPLVGREQEVGLLLECWERVKEGMGQVLMLSGEAGIGKSRLVQVMKDRVIGEQHTRIESRGSPYHQNTALYPVIDHLKRLLQFKREDPPEEKLGKVEGILVKYGLPLEEMVPLFSSLLSVPLPDRYPSLKLTPQMQKRKTLEALISWLLKEAEKQPVLRIVEDLHWVDPSTLEYLSLLIEQVPTARILTLFTFRPDFSPPWPMRSHLSQITLTRLTKQQVEVMVDKLAGGRALPSEVVQQVVVKTDGVPLFVEELTKMVLESGLLREHDDHYELTGSLPQVAIPATLQDSFMARLDRVDTGEICGLGATLGREFTYDLLQAVSPLDEEPLKRELAKLIESELLYQRGHPPQATYMFKHALIQDAAYQSLLRGKRQHYHQKIAEVLEKHFPETAETQPELLAHHYTEAGLIEKAIPFWQAAGQRAIERSANVEAIGHLNKGLNLIMTQPEIPERTQQELDLLITLGPALTAAKGYAAPEVEKAYIQARELCQQVGETPQLFPVLRGLWGFYHVRAESQVALELAEQLLSLAQSVREPGFLLWARFALGITSYWLAEFAPARAHLEQGIALYDPHKHHPHAFGTATDPGVGCLSYAAWTLWCLGYPEQALKRSHEAIALAQDVSHPFSLACALHFAAVLHQYRREGPAAQKRAEAAITLSTEQGFPFWLAWGTVMRGWALAEQACMSGRQGQMEEGIAQTRQGLAASRATGAELDRPYFLALLAETYGKVGQTEEGLTVLAEALAVVDKNGELHYEAELYRLKGELVLQRGNAEAEACFVKAIDIARRQGARSLELRAVTSLSRLLQKQGKKDEARQMLSEIYGWFTEGFDTKDLKESKALLEQLS